MSVKEALSGLTCPRCGGIVPIPEGQAIVICPFCQQRSVVRGENGVRRYQVPNRIDREKADQAFRKFLGNMAIAGSVKREAQMNEVLMVHLPFWVTWGRVLGWVFGEESQGTGKDRRMVPKEKKVVQDMTWNAAACDVGEFGVSQVNLEGRPVEPFDSRALHSSGMVFEPTSSAGEALEQSRLFFENQVSSRASLSKVSQTAVRIIRPRQGLVYYPMWVMRYTYRGRAFQVVVDGFNGEVLYGKAPGNVFYRSAVLVGGMALGAFLSIDVGISSMSLINEHSDNGWIIPLALILGGLAIMYFAFRTYRYGEHYEYRRMPARTVSMPFSMNAAPADAAREIGNIIKQLERLP